MRHPPKQNHCQVRGAEPFQTRPPGTTRPLAGAEDLPWAGDSLGHRHGRPGPRGRLTPGPVARGHDKHSYCTLTVSRGWPTMTLAAPVG